MKRIPALLVLLLCSSVLFGQELKLVDFHADMSMTDAAQYPKKDANGVNCGLVKLALVIPEAEFEGDIISADYSKGEWLIYMMKGANWITVKTQQYQPLRCDLPPIESNVTYVMVVEIPPSDSTDYYLEQARLAAGRNDVERLVQCVEKVPRTAVPDDLLALYDDALSVMAQNEVINNLKQRTKNFTSIPDKETFDQCRSFITKYPHSEYFSKVSNLLRTEGRQFVQGQSSDNKGPRVPSSSTTSVSSGKNAVPYKTSIKPSTKKSDPFVSLLSAGVGIEAFITRPDSSKVSYDTSKTYSGLDVSALLRIGQPENIVNGILGVGVSTGSFIKNNLHVSPEVRINMGGETGVIYGSLGADISLLSFGNNNTEETVISSGSCVRIMVGYIQKKYDLYLGVRAWTNSIGGASFGLGFRWYLF